MDCFSDLVVSTTAADVGDNPVNILVRGLGIALQQSCSCHDHSSLAVTALRYVHLDPGQLNRMAAVHRKPLYGGDRFSTFDDGMPVQIDLSLAFKEIELLDKQRVLSGY